ncbi:MAG: Lrp/AsnC family transcriptional regulator [Alphaproteobacteria bacterium]|nr:MAG: Lrp/AsnC family transcriptional regulator [Alphaproteobacteria bacterium]
MDLVLKSPNLDRIDRAILRAVHDNGRISIQGLSQRVGLSPSPCARRLRLLEERGIITGYRALLDERKLGYGVSVFVSVKLDKQVDEALQTFEAAIRAYPEVVDCWLMTGTRDYLLRVATRDLADFEDFLTSRLTRVPGVASIESAIPLRRVKAGISRGV